MRSYRGERKPGRRSYARGSAFGTKLTMLLLLAVLILLAFITGLVRGLS
jgi:hypothetical protein